MMRRLALFIVMLFSASPVFAQNEQIYVQPSPEALVQTLFRFGALNPEDSDVLDDYAKLSVCDLYRHFYKDDFKWNEIRNILRRKIRSELPSYPTAYSAVGRLYLDRYDFEKNIFKLGIKSGLNSVNSFILVEMEKFPCGVQTQTLPSEFVAVIEEPVTVEGFDMSAEDAQALLKRMERSGNKTREVKVRFNLRIVFVDRIMLNDIGYSEKKQAPQSLRLDAQLDSVEFFEDKDMTRRIFVYEPR